MQACHPDFTLFSTELGCLAHVNRKLPASFRAENYVIFILLIHDWFAEFIAKTMGKECGPGLSSR